MNRVERRRLKKQGKAVSTEPILMMKPSEIGRAATQGIGREAMLHEINQQLLRKDQEFTKDVDAMVLWTLHSHYGWGPKRLKDFYRFMFSEHLKMREHYELDDLYPERMKLNDIGVDLDELYQMYFEEDGTFKRGVLTDE